MAPVTYEDMVNLASGIFAAIIVLSGLAFVIYYTTKLPWWQKEAGRNLIVVTIGLVGLAAMTFGDGYRGQATLNMIFLAVIAAAITWRLIMLIRYVHAGDRATDKDERRETVNR